MKQLIGIHTIALLPQNPKQDLLLFDRLCVPIFKSNLELLKLMTKSDSVKEKLDDLEWLYDSGYIFDSQIGENSSIDDDEFREVKRKFSIVMDKFKQYKSLSDNEKEIQRDSIITDTKLWFTLVDVYQVVLRNLPIPDDTTSFEQIIDFRNDAESREKIIALKNWINEMSKGNLSASELDDKLQYLANEYKRYTKLHKMKTNTMVSSKALEI